MDNQIPELDWLKKWNQYSPKAIAIIDGENGETLNYESLFLLSQKCATVLEKKYQVKAGDNLLVIATNHIWTIILFFAAARLGATLVPINSRLVGPEMAYLINNSNPRLILAEELFLPLLESVKKQIQNLEVVTIEIQELKNQSLSEKDLYPEFLSNDDTTALIIYTSGTTGFPKGAMISHTALFWNAVNTSLRLNITSVDKAVIFLPLFHTGGWNVLTTPFFMHGASIVLTKKFDANQILSLSSYHKCTLLFGVPTTMQALSQAPIFYNCDLSAIRYAIVGGEPLPIEQIETWNRKQIPIRQGYGLTEFGPNVFSLGEDDCIRKKGSIGFPNFFLKTKVMIKSESGLIEARPNEIGELWLKGPMCMTGYFGNATATKETIQDGWLKTGDMVYFDSEGYYYVVGRNKDMYKSGGENVYPAEIERVLCENESIVEAAVIGVPDEKWGEVGHAFVVLRSNDLSGVESGVNNFQNQIMISLKDKLAKYKIPKYFSVLPALPKGDSGKILKRALIERIT